LVQRRQVVLNGIPDPVGASLLGLNIGCVRCHDHKYDPIPQRDYYRLQAFFAAIRPRDDLNLIPPDRRPEYDRRLQEWEEKTSAIRTELASMEDPVRQKIAKVSLDKCPKETQSAVSKPASQRTAMDWLLDWR